MRMLIAAAAVLLTASAATAEDVKMSPAPQTTVTTTTTEQTGEAALSVPEATAQEQEVAKTRGGYEGCHGRKSVERLIM